MQTRTKRTRAAPKVAAAAPEAVVVLEGTLDLNAASRLQATLLDRRGTALSIDASGVGHLGALCAQILASALSTWAADAAPLRIADPSEAFVRGARLLGLHATLMPDSERP